MATAEERKRERKNPTMCGYCKGPCKGEIVTSPWGLACVHGVPNFGPRCPHWCDDPKPRCSCACHVNTYKCSSCCPVPNAN